jgi:hypothetical protein
LRGAFKRRGVEEYIQIRQETFLFIRYIPFPLFVPWVLALSSCYRRRMVSRHRLRETFGKADASIVICPSFLSFYSLLVNIFKAHTVFGTFPFFIATSPFAVYTKALGTRASTSISPTPPTPWLQARLTETGTRRNQTRVLLIYRSTTQATVKSKKLSTSY